MVLLPSAKQGQFQNMPSDVQCFQKAKSTAQPYWSEFSFKSLCGQASPCSTTSSAVVFCRQTSRQACQPNGSLLCTPLCRHYGWLTEYQNSHSNFKCSAQNFLHDLTPGFSCGELVSAIFVSSSVSLTLFQLPSLVKARVCSYAKHPGRASASPTQLPTKPEQLHSAFILFWRGLLCKLLFKERILQLRFWKLELCPSTNPSN